MKLTQLLQARPLLARQARLANLAFAYETLRGFGRRIARAGLCGRVTLRAADPDNDVFWAQMIALEGSQAVIEEHFTDEDLCDLADAVSFVTGQEDFEVTFRLEEFCDHFVAPLRSALEEAGIEIDTGPAPAERQSSEDRSR